MFFWALYAAADGDARRGNRHGVFRMDESFSSALLRHTRIARPIARVLSRQCWPSWGFRLPLNCTTNPQVSVYESWRFTICSCGLNVANAWILDCAGEASGADSSIGHVRGGHPSGSVWNVRFSSRLHAAGMYGGNGCWLNYR